MAKTATSTFIKAPCARCGTRLREGYGNYLYSSFTRSHYCIDIDACAKRARRQKKATA